MKKNETFFCSFVFFYFFFMVKNPRFLLGSSFVDVAGMV